MDSKFYVSFEVARMLKETGYNEECDYIIDDDGGIFEDKYRINQDLPEWKWSCPTKDEAIDWLDSKGIIIEIFQDYRKLWFYVIKRSKTESYVSEADDKYFSTRLEAKDAAIIKALELIKIRTNDFS